ncbi:hypothetical protein D917_09036, partial [Trichinella nativa]
MSLVTRSGRLMMTAWCTIEQQAGNLALLKARRLIWLLISFTVPSMHAVRSVYPYPYPMS